MRRVTRTIQHLIAGSVANQRVARANAATANATLEAGREDREAVADLLLLDRAAEVGPFTPRDRIFGGSHNTKLPAVAVALVQGNLAPIAVLHPASEGDT